MSGRIQSIVKQREARRAAAVLFCAALGLAVGLSLIPLASGHLLAASELEVAYATEEAAGAAQQKTPAKAVAKSPAKAPAKAAARRDPFSPLVERPRPGGAAAAAAALPEKLPPGKAGLVIRVLRVDGVVRGPNGMIAVVVNHQNRVFFLREGDQLYDGRVERINMEGVTFRETGRDEQGNVIDRVVVKRIYPTPGA